MNIKQLWEEFLNKKWGSDDLLGIAFSILIASFLTMPLFGIPNWYCSLFYPFL